MFKYSYVQTKILINIISLRWKCAKALRISIVLLVFSLGPSFTHSFISYTTTLFLVTYFVLRVSVLHCISHKKHTFSFFCSLTLSHTHSHKYPYYAHSRTHTLSFTQSHTLSHMHIRTHSHSNAHSHTHPHTLSHTLLLEHTRTCTNTSY